MRRKTFIYQAGLPGCDEFTFRKSGSIRRPRLEAALYDQAVMRMQRLLAQLTQPLVDV